MRKVSVSTSLFYTFSCEIPDELTGDEAMNYCDFEDPVFKSFCKILEKNNLNYDAEINSIIDEETDEVLYDY